MNRRDLPFVKGEAKVVCKVRLTQNILSDYLKISSNPY